MENKIKHIKGDKQGSRDELQNNHGQLFDNSKSSC